MSKRKKISKKKEVLLPAIIVATISCFIIPLLNFNTTLDPVLYPRFLAWSVSILVLLFVLWVLLKNDKFQLYKIPFPLIIAFGVFLLITVLTLIPAINPYEGITDLFKWFLFFLFIIIIVQVFTNSRKAFEIIVKAVLIYSIIAVVIGLYQFFDDALLNNDPNAIHEVKGLSGHKNQFSISLFLLLPFVIASWVVLPKSWQMIKIASSGLILIMLAILQTRAVWIAMFISGFVLIIMLLFKYRKKVFSSKKIKSFLSIVLLLLLAFVVGAFLFPDLFIYKRLATIINPDYTSNEWRIEMWNATYHLFLDNWFRGVGGGNWKIAIYPYYSDYLPSVYRHWRAAHNDYLEIAAEKGLFGLLSYIWIYLLILYFGIIRIFNETDKKEIGISVSFLFGIVGYMIISFFSFPATRIYHFVFLSILMAGVIAGYLKTMGQDGYKYKSHWKFYFLIPIIVVYMSAHFGTICIQSELNLVKLKVFKQKNDLKNFELYADKAYSKFAPIEAVSSLPIIMFKGLLEFQKQNFEKANVYFLQGYKEHPNSISVLNNIGGAYGGMKEYDSALVYYQKALTIFPHYEYSLLNSAKAHYMKNDLENAYITILYCDPKSKNEEIKQFREFLKEKID